MKPIDPTNDPNPIGGIGPFTKEQNYERKDNVPPEPSTSSRPQRGIGPFTKEQNINVPADEKASVEISFVPKDGEENKESDSNKSLSSPWTYVDVSDAGSNSLENTETESGRAFSGSSFLSSSTTETPSRSSHSPPSMEYQREVQEPVLRMTKKETGRSMRLPEITEPILRPRATRQNFKGDPVSRQDDPVEEESSNSSQVSRSFTVQFLPERLAGILAQAERYARQTLLPLISQYTPSFIGSSRQDRVKYFPPLTDIDEDEPTDDGLVLERAMSSGNTENRSNEVENSSEPSASGANEAIESFESVGRKAVLDVDSSDWIPIDGPNHSNKLTRSGARNERNSSRSFNTENWMSEDGGAWNPPVEDTEAGPDTKIDDWLPILDNTTKIKNQAELTELPEVATTTTVKVIEEEITTSKDADRKFIPLVDFENRDDFLAPTEGGEEIVKSEITSTEIPSHIQKIPGPVERKESVEREENKRAMIFPYAYERKNDPRTRYIPLIPEEEMGRTKPIVETDRWWDNVTVRSLERITQNQNSNKKPLEK